MSGLIPDGRKGGVRETITRIAKALGADLACRHHNAGTGRSIADPTVAKIAHEAGRTPAHLLARDGVTIHAHELPRVRRGLASGWQSIHLSPGQKILRAIDSFTVKNAPFFRLLFSAHVPSYFAAMDHMLDYDFQTVAPAPPRRCALSTGCRHGSRSGMDAVVARAPELMAAWDQRLGGTDIFLTDNLNAVAWSLHNG